MKNEKSLFLRAMHKKHVQAPTDMRMNSHPQKIMNRTFKHPSGTRHGASGLWGLFVALLCTLGMALPAGAQTSANYAVVSQSLASESCPNQAIDPGETLTYVFVFKKTTDGTHQEVQADLLASGNVDFQISKTSPSSNVSKDGQYTATITFRAKGACADPAGLVATLRVSRADGSSRTSEDLVFGALPLGETVTTTYTFSNTNPITIRDNNTATPYPSTISASGIPNVSGNGGDRVKRIEVTLNNVTHAFSRDINALLVGPTGKKVVLMREAGGATLATALISDANLTFAEAGSAMLPANGKITSGTYKPSDYATGDFPSGAPAGPYNTQNLNTAFADVDGNGTWQLFVSDDQAGDAGQIAGGWTLKLITTKVVCCGVGQTDPVITQGTAANTKKPGIGGVTINEDVENTVVPFSVDDLETAVGSLTVTATSGNTDLVLSSELAIEGGASGENKSLKIKKLVANKFGTAPITVNVTDGSGRSKSATFTLTVNSVNDAPTFPTTVGGGRNQSLNRGARTPALAFTVGDVEDDPANLVVTATAVNSGISPTTDDPVVPNSNIFLSGTGANRTVTVIPRIEGASAPAAQATITLKVRDSNGSEATAAFIVKFEAEAPNPANPSGEPTISPINDVTTNEDTASTAAFTIRPGSGSSTSADNLTVTRSVTALSGDTDLLPVANIAVGGSGTERTVTMTPAANKTGSVTVLITVTDGTKANASANARSAQFTLNVSAVNDQPTITAISNQTINEDTQTGDIAFTIGDIETSNLSDFVANAGSGKRVTVSSSNTTLVPNAVQTSGDLPSTGGIKIGGTGANRTVTLRPAADQFGRATITVTINDNSGGDTATATSSFILTVEAVNDAPTLVAVKRLTPTVAADQSSLPGNSTDEPVLVTIDENDPARVDVEEQIQVIGISAGPTTAGASESDQTVTITATHNNSDLITSLSVDPASLTNPNTTATIKYKVGKNKFGEAVITLTATDNGSGGVNSTVRKFKLRVTEINDQPTLAAIANQTVPAGQGISVPITLTDVETTAARMISVTKTSSNTAVAEDSNVILDVINSRVTIVTKSNAALNATSTISLKFRDRGSKDDATTGGLETATQTFVVTITAATPENNAPTATINPSSRTILEDGLATADITVADAQDASAVTLSGTSSDTSIVPNGNILFGGTGGSRTMAVVPLPDKSGSVTITVVATDGGITVGGNAGQNKLSSAPQTFTLSISPVEDTPTISLVDAGPVTVDEDTNPVKIGDNLVRINVSDAETSADALVVTAASSNTTIVPNANITISTTGGQRTATIVPVANLSGETKITFTVKDSANTTVNAPGFIVLVRSINDPPGLADISNSTIDEDAGTTTPITVQLTGLTAGGGETGQTLTITASATPATLIVPASITVTPNSINVTDASTSSSASVSFKTFPDQFGTAEFTINVTDNGTSESGNRGAITSAAQAKTTTKKFQVVINPVNDAPTINPIANLTINQDSVSAPIPVTVLDKENESRADQLVVSFSSSNTALVPNTTENLQPTGSGNNRGVIIKPLAGAAGEADITVKVTDTGISSGAGVLSGSLTFKVTVIAGQKPTITSIAAQTIKVNEDTPVISVTVNDAQTPAANLTVTAASDNTNLVPTGNIQFGGGGSTRQFIIRPAANQSGTANITITVRDADGNVAESKFKLTVLGQAPTISAIADQTVKKNGTTGAIAFSVNDAETFPGFLTVAASSSNQAFVPNSKVVLGGSGPNRTVTVAPAADQEEGTTTITLSVTDGEGQTVTRTFVVATPAPTNNAPTISSIPNQTAQKDQPSSLIPFTISDTETAVGSLIVTASSSSQEVLPNGNIFLGGSGGSRTALISAGKEGTSTITITVTDTGPGAAKSASTSFLLTVSANVAPTISAIGAQSTDKNKATAAVSFTVGDTETAAGSLTVAGASSNETLAPNANISVSGSGATRSVVVTPANNQVGTASITLTVTDGGGLKASTSFTLTVKETAAAKGDFDGDGAADVVFQDDSGFVAAWLMNGANLKQASFLVPSNIGDTNYRIAATGDFNRDGQEDILFQHTDGTLAVWFMTGTLQTSAELITPSKPGDPNWRAVASGDINGDGSADIVLQHNNGTLGVWFLNGTTLTSGALLTPSSLGDAGWKIVGLGDFNSDGKLDLALQYTNGTLGVWYLNGTTLTSATLMTPSSTGDANWRVVGVADRNGDGKPDLLVQHSNYTIGVWYMNGVTLSSAALINPSNSGATWRIVSPK